MQRKPCLNFKDNSDPKRFYHWNRPISHNVKKRARRAVRATCFVEDNGYHTLWANKHSKQAMFAGFAADVRTLLPGKVLSCVHISTKTSVRQAEARHT